MNLWDPPAEFVEPLVALSACHRRIEKQIAALARLQKHVAHSGFDHEARDTAAAILAYFIDATPRHYADEQDLFPMVLRAAEASADRALAFDMVAHLLVEQGETESNWVRLREALECLQTGEKSEIDSQLCKDFTSNYLSHIDREDKQLFPLAARLLSKADLDALGCAMAKRRGLPPPVFIPDK